MILVTPDGEHPLALRAATDTRVATASYMVAQALEGTMPWAACWACVSDTRALAHAELVLLQHIIHAANSPVRLQRALLKYIRFLDHDEGEIPCALYFAEVTRSLGTPSDELMVELGTLYRKASRFVEAGDVWGELELRGLEQNNLWLQLRARVGRGIVERHKGNLGLAEHHFHVVSGQSAEFPDLRAMARHNLGTVYDHQVPPRYEDAALAYWDAYFLHDDPAAQLQALMDVGTAAVGCQNYALADVCFRMVAGRSTCWEARTNCLIERLDVCSALNDPAALIEVKAALVFRRPKLSHRMLVDYEYRLGLVDLRAGKPHAAKVHWETARTVAVEHQLWDWDAKLRGVLEAAPAPAQPEESPRLERVYVDCRLQCVLAGY